MYQFYDDLLKSNSVEILITIDMINELVDEFIQDCKFFIFFVSENWIDQYQDVRVVVQILLEHFSQVINKFENLKIQ